MLLSSATTPAEGVLEYDVTADDVPGVLWTPPSADPGTPLVLLGHGGGLHKRFPGLVARAHDYVRRGFAVAAIDAPGHGDRPRDAADARSVAALRDARAAGEPLEAIIAEFNVSLAERAVPEWQAAIDALTALPGIGSEAPIAFTGMTLASAIGLLLMARDPRITAGIVGGVSVSDPLVEAARRVTVPIRFLVSWDDPEIDRHTNLALFDAIGSEEKSLHSHPGAHHQVPWWTVEESARFLERQLGASPRSPVDGRG